MDKHNFIDRWKATAEELQLQLHLGSKELGDKFEDQKKEILHWSQDTREKLEGEVGTAATELRAKLERLELQAALGKAETKEAIQEQRKKMAALVSEAHESSTHLLGDSKKNLGELAAKANTKLDEWHTKFDLLRLHISLGAAEASDEWKEKKEDLKESLHKLESKLDDLSEDSEESWSNFKGEIAEAWTHVKKAFSKTD